MPLKRQSYPDHDDTLLISIYDKYNVNGKQWVKICSEYNEKMTGRGEWTKEQIIKKVNNIKFMAKKTLNPNQSGQQAPQIVDQEEQIIVPSTSAGNPSSQQAAVVSEVSTPMQYAPMKFVLPSTGNSSVQQTVVVSAEQTPIQYAPVNIEETNSGNGEIQEKPSIIGIM